MIEKVNVFHLSMLFPEHIFKKYDIRGLTGSEITPELAYKIGRAFCSLIAEEQGGRMPTIVVGRDMRETSPAYAQALEQGLLSLSARVLDIGLVSTPAFYFGVGHLQADGGVMVSASHNPAAYNGFKLTRSRALPVSGETGILEVANRVRGQMKDTGWGVDWVSVEGSGVEVVDGIPALAAQAEFLHAGVRAVKKLKIVADAANGMGAQYLDELFTMIDADVTRLYWKYDGNFPHHEADPMKEENTADLQAKVVEVGADLGIATDGDGDRIFFVDEQGKRVDPAVLRGLLAQIVLRQYPGANICYDIRPGRITEDLIRESGGTPYVTQVGHSLIKECMREQNAPFGGESSGHFFYAFEQGTFEGPVTVAVQLMQEMTERNVPLSHIVDPLQSRYAHSGEINFDVQDKAMVIDRIKTQYTDGELSELDGITITYPTFWFNVRGSNTEPKLRLNLEAIDRTIMEAKRDELTYLIQQ